MLISRILFEELQTKIDFKKALLLLGPRQVGKTTLVKKIAESISSNFLYLNGDEASFHNSLSEASISFLRSYLGQSKVVVWDEAQRIPKIGLTLKLIVDNFTDLQLIVTGSSALDLSSTINAPLTGRKWAYKMYPLSWMEISSSLGIPEALSSLETYLVYGTYPEIVKQKGNGIRNAIIGNYAPIPARNDIGALWENYLISKRRKLLAYNGFYGKTYFWRAVRGQEIDYLEEIDGELYPFEFRWNPNEKLKIPKTFQEAYTSETSRMVHRDNFWEWLNAYPYQKA